MYFRATWHAGRSSGAVLGGLSRVRQSSSAFIVRFHRGEINPCFSHLSFLLECLLNINRIRCRRSLNSPVRASPLPPPPPPPPCPTYVTHSSALDGLGMPIMRQGLYSLEDIEKKMMDTKISANQPLGTGPPLFIYPPRNRTFTCCFIL